MLRVGREIFGWWYDTAVDSDMVDALKSMFFTGLAFCPGGNLTDEGIASSVKLLADNGLKWAVVKAPSTNSYEGLIYYFTLFKDHYYGFSPKPSWVEFDDLFHYVWSGNYLDAVRAANEIFGEDGWYAVENLELFNPHPHEMHPEVYIKHLSYYDTPQNTMQWLEYEIKNNWSYKTLGAFLWTKVQNGCGWTSEWMTEEHLRQFYQFLISLGCIRLDFFGFFPDDHNGQEWHDNNLLNHPEWWPLIRELNLELLGNPSLEFTRQIEDWGEPVTVQRRYRAGTDDYGDPIYEWDYYLTEKAIVRSLKGSEVAASAGRYTSEDMKAYLSPLTQIRQGDRVIIDDEYYSVDFLAERRVKARPYYCEAILKRVIE